MTDTLEEKLAKELAKNDRAFAKKRITEIDRQITKLEREKERIRREADIDD